MELSSKTGQLPRDGCEIALIGDAVDNSFLLYDLPSQTLLRSYKGNTCADPRAVSLLGTDYLLAGSSKPIINVWNWFKPQLHLRIPCPGKITALTCTPCSTFCIVGLGTSIYIWEAATGRLLAILEKHVQAVSVLCCTDDGSHFLSGGLDGIIVVWNLSHVLSASHRGQLPQTRCLLHGHTSSVTDIWCGHGGLQARVLTSSLDGSCKVWELSSGLQLRSLVHGCAVTAACMDLAEHHVFAGLADGLIRKSNTCQLPIGNQPYNVTEQSTVCEGHRGAIKSVSVSRDGKFLLSASEDGTVCLWLTSVCRCLRQLERKGPVTFARFISPLRPLLRQQPRNLQLSLAPLALFQRVVSDGQSSTAEQTCPIRLHSMSSFPAPVPRSFWQRFLWQTSAEETSTVSVEASQPNDTVQLSSAQVKEKMADLLSINEQLYRIASQRLLANVDQVAVCSEDKSSTMEVT